MNRSFLVAFLVLFFLCSCSQTVVNKDAPTVVNKDAPTVVNKDAPTVVNNDTPEDSKIRMLQLEFMRAMAKTACRETNSSDAKCRRLLESITADSEQKRINEVLADANKQCKKEKFTDASCAIWKQLFISDLENKIRVEQSKNGVAK